MNILIIAWKEVKTSFRDIRTLFFMFAFPIILMLVLGTALSGAFTTSITVEDIHVLYKDKTKNESFQQFIKGVEESHVYFKKIGKDLNGEKEVKLGKYDGYVEVTQSGVRLFINRDNSITGSILEGMLASYVDHFNIAQEIVKVDPMKLNDAFTREKPDSYVQETSLNPDRQPSSMDYYGIVMTTMIVLYGAMSSTSSIVSERVRKTADRLIAAPIKKSEIFIGKVLGCLVSNSVCILLVILVSRLLFHVNWGDQIGLVLLVLLTEMIFAVSFGIGVSFITKTSSAPPAIIMTFVQLASFFGGAYFKVENPEGLFKIITDLSPLTWVNNGIINIIYANDFGAAIPAMGINLVGALVFLFIAVLSLQRREGL